MEAIAVILIVWSFVTVLGHGTWVFLAAMFRGVRVDQWMNKASVKPSEADDLAATRRVVERLVGKRLIEDQQADWWRSRLRELTREENSHVAAARETVADPTKKIVIAKLADDPSRSQPVIDPVSVAGSLQVVAPERTAGPRLDAVDASPAFSAAGLVQSFLDRRNIRWGELAAGMLIVVCSIGLVISLWNPLVQTHAVVPSMLFLAANAAIYAAGLYTLGRWKVRHTSRAVLVIATLLVPLSVSAGMAAAGTSSGAVRLTDPVTLAAIAVASLIYTALVYRGGIALVRRHLAPALTLAVIGPVAVLPMLPAAIRSWGANAGWIVLVGGMSVAAAILWTHRISKTKAVRPVVWSPTSARGRGWVSILGVFALGVTIFAAGFGLRDRGIVAWLPVALGTLPAIAGLATAAFAMMRRARSGTHSLSGSVTCVVAIGLALAMMPPMMVGSFWIWSWGGILASGLLIAAMVIRVPSWQAAATIPIGTAALLSSPVWIGGQTWDQVGWRPGLLGGEPMVVAAGWGIACGLIAWALRRTEWKQAWVRASGGWLALATGIAISLAFLPVAASGVVPAVVITSWLIAVTIALSFAARQGLLPAISQHRWVGWLVAVISVTAAFAWISVLRPIEIDVVGLSLVRVAAMGSWMPVFLAVALTWIALGEVWPNTIQRAGRARVIGSRIFWQLAVVAVSLLSIMACVDIFSASAGWRAVGMLAAAMVMLGWLSMAMRSASVLRIAQLVSLALAIAAVHIGLPGHLWPTELLTKKNSWTSCSPWAWAWLLAAVGGVWTTLESLAGWSRRRFPLTAVADRLAVIRCVGGFDRVMVIGSVTIGLVIAIGSLVRLEAAALGLPVDQMSAAVVDPMLAIVGTAAALALAWVTTKDRDWICSGAFVCFLLAVLWSSIRIVLPMELTDVARLVCVTSLVAAAMACVRRWNMLADSVVIGLVSISSAILLIGGGIEPLVDAIRDAGWNAGIVVDPVVAMSLASWWIVIGLRLFLVGRNTVDSGFSTVPVTLIPFAGFIATLVMVAMMSVVSLRVTVVGMLAWLAATTVVSLARTVANRNRIDRAIDFDFGHIASLAALLPMLTWFADVPMAMRWTALAVVAIAGVWTAVIQRHSFSGASVSVSMHEVAIRLLGWWVIAAGAWTLVDQIDPIGGTLRQLTLALGWGVAWWVVWSIAAVIHAEDVPRRKVTPTAELMTLFKMALLIEIGVAVLLGDWLYDGGMLEAITLFRWMLYGIVFALPLMITIAMRSNLSDRAADSMSVGVGLVVIVSVQTAIEWQAFWSVRWMVAVVTAGFIVALVSQWLPLLARLLSCRSNESRLATQQRLVSKLTRIVWFIAAGAVAGSLLTLADGAEPWVQQMMIGSLALCAWAMAVLAEWSDESGWLPAVGVIVPSKRHAAVGLAMVTIGLWAMLGQRDVIHLGLEASMRGLVAAVISIPLWIFVAPALLGRDNSVRWSKAFRFGAGLGVVAASIALVTMIGLELSVRSYDGIDGVSRRHVIVVAVVLAMLSGLAGSVAIGGFRGREGREPSALAMRLGCSDSTRRYLVVAAQVIGGLAWFHLYLCKSPLALTGMRPYWPFVVMTLAFASVGLTEWARRRGDRVIADMMKQTAMYLPLIPVVGFWLTAFWFGDVSEGDGWSYRGGRVSYQWMLVLGAAYYAGVSSIWKRSELRVGSILLANAAWWVLLVQQSGWEFLSHPQAWLIPPAACVLLIAQFYRDRIEPVLLASIRYGAMLVIYLSSTADMLLHEIGSHLSGPIVLVSLALAGMLAGVVLRIRPFLHLGAMFVFLGAASMVRYAQVSLDAVWPWWVFGITTGVLLLVGLTLLEKNKSKLRRAVGVQ